MSFLAKSLSECLMLCYALVLMEVVDGLFTGSVGIIHSVVGDLTDHTNASLIFPIYDTVAAVGFIIG
jgi:hypothetical protein